MHLESSGSSLRFRGSGGLSPSPGSATDPAGLGRVPRPAEASGGQQTSHLLTSKQVGGPGHGQCGAVSSHRKSEPHPHFIDQQVKAQRCHTTSSKESSIGGFCEEGMR